MDIFTHPHAEFTPLPGGSRRRIRSYDSELMAVEVEFEAGGTGAPHTHPHTQLTYCLRGEFEFTLNGRTYLLRPGDTLLFPAGAEHGCTALSDGALLDVFTPAREDFLPGAGK